MSVGRYGQGTKKAASELLHTVELFMAVFPEIGPSKFGRLAMSDPRFVGDLRAGRRPRPATRKKAYDFMENYNA